MLECTLGADLSDFARICLQCGLRTCAPVCWVRMYCGSATFTNLAKNETKFMNFQDLNHYAHLFPVIWFLLQSFLRLLTADHGFYTLTSMTRPRYTGRPDGPSGRLYLLNDALRHVISCSLRPDSGSECENPHISGMLLSIAK